MWKTNKWVPEWVIRHAIAHLHPGLQPPCRCAISIMEGRPQTGGKPVPSESRPALSWLPILSQRPHPLSLYLKAKNKEYLMSSFCQISGDSLVTKAFFFSSAFSTCTQQIFTAATIFMNLGNLLSHTIHHGHCIATTLAALSWNVCSMLLSQGLCSIFLSA